MDNPSEANPTVTDTNTSAQEVVVGQAPAVALSQLYLATAQALSLAAHNATAQQQHTNQLAQAATARGVALLLGLPPSELGVPPPGASNLNANPSPNNHKNT